jgi:hypothetical protein
VLQKDREDSWTGHVRNEEVLCGLKEERDVLHTLKGRKANLIGYISYRNCILKHVIDGNVERR